MEGAGATVAGWVRRHVKTVSAEASLAELVVSFADSRISALPVVDDGGRLLGVVSYAGFMQAEAEIEAAGEEDILEFLEDTRVRDIMVPRALTISPEADLAAAARQMLDTGVHQLVVASGDQLIGAISTIDIVRAVASCSR